MKPDLTKLGWFDKTIDLCTVVSIPAGATPKFVKVRLPGSDGAIIDAWWSGIPDLEVDSTCSLRYSAGLQAQYTISGGGTGTAPPSAHTHTGGNVWPLPDKANIGSTEYATLALAAAAAVSGDVIRLGEGTFTCDNIVLGTGVSLEGSGNKVTILSQTTDANCLTINNARGANFQIAMAISSANTRIALNLTGNLPQVSEVVIDAINSGAGDCDGIVSAGTGDPLLALCDVHADRYALYVNNLSSIVVVEEGHYLGGVTDIQVDAGFANLLFPYCEGFGVTPYPLTRGIWFDTLSRTRVETATKSTPIGADQVLISDSEASDSVKKANISDLQTSASHIHGLARWDADGGTTYDFPDVVEYIDTVSLDGLEDDPLNYTLSTDNTQLVFDSVVTAGVTILCNYVIGVL